jgi:hypothetical protein
MSLTYLRQNRNSFFQFLDNIDGDITGIFYLLIVYFLNSE